MNSKLKALTGLRFFAAATIVVHHLKSFGILPKTFLDGWPLENGVSFFFVLSGFILAYRYPSLDSPGSVRSFLVARASRIWPVHLATFALVLIVASAPRHPAYLWLNNLTLTQSWVPASKAFFGYNSPSWSISTEMAFYLAFPFLIRNFARSWWWKLPLTLFMALVSIRLCSEVGATPYNGVSWQTTAMWFTYISPLARLLEFTLGMCVALAFASLRPRIKFTRPVGTLIETAAILAFVVNASYIENISSFVGSVYGAPAADWIRSSSALCLGTAFLILIMALEQGYISRIIGGKVGIFLGEISFSVYMLHYVILLGYWKHASKFSAWSEAEKLCTFTAILLLASWAMWKYCEKPARDAIFQRFSARSPIFKMIHHQNNIADAPPAGV